MITKAYEKGWLAFYEDLEPVADNPYPFHQFKETDSEYSQWERGWYDSCEAYWKKKNDH